MVTEIKEKAAIYCRVSTRGQKEEGTSLEGQYEFLKAWIKRDYPDLDIKLNSKTMQDHFSEDHTGTTFDRPVWNQVKALVTAGEIKHVFVFNMTRFTRPQSEESWMDVIEEMNFFKKNNVDLHIEDDKNKGLGALASVMTTFQVTNAHMDYTGTVTKMLKGKKDRVLQQKKAHTGRRYSQYGYNYISKRRHYDSDKAGTYEINEEEAKWVKFIFEKYSAGYSGLSISKMLNERGIPTKTGKKWVGQVVVRNIKEKIYKGEETADFYWNAGETPKVENLPLGEAFAPAIVSKELWEKCAAIHGKKTFKRSDRKFLLSGLLICGLCGSNIHVRLANKKYEQASCSNRITEGSNAYKPEKCELLGFRHESVAAAVWQQIEAIVSDKKTLLKALAEAKLDQSPILNEELELLIEKMKEIPKQKKKLREQHILFGDDMSESEMKSLYKSIDQEEVETSNRISQIEKLITEIEETQIAGVDIERWMINLDQWLNSASTKEELNARQRYVLDQLNVRVVINKRNEDGSVEFSLETLLPSNMKNTFSEILKMKDYFQSQNDTSFPTIEQTWAL
jgi:site-specific DNA recombinase